MKHLILISIIVLFYSFQSKGQDLHALEPNLSTMVSSTLWYLGVANGNDSDAIKDTLIVDYVKNNLDSMKLQMTTKEKALWLKHKDQIYHFLHGIYIIGDELPYYLHMGSELPIKFVEFNKKTTLFLDVGFGFKYNSIKLKPKERYMDVFEKRLISLIPDIVRSFKETSDIELFCISFTYGVEDFSADFNLDKSETILFLFTYDDAFKLDNFRITNEEFLKDAIIIAQQNGSNKATKVTLQQK